MTAGEFVEGSNEFIRAGLESVQHRGEVLGDLGGIDPLRPEIEGVGNKHHKAATREFIRKRPASISGLDELLQRLRRVVRRGDLLFSEVVKAAVIMQRKNWQPTCP